MKNDKCPLTAKQRMNQTNLAILLSRGTDRAAREQMNADYEAEFGPVEYPLVGQNNVRKMLCECFGIDLPPDPKCDGKWYVCVDFDTYLHSDGTLHDTATGGYYDTKDEAEQALKRYRETKT